MPRLKAQSLAAPFKALLISDEFWSEIKDDYLPLTPDIQAADSELEVWKHTTSNVETDDLCILLEHWKSMFPNVLCIVKILLTMPISTATAKRSFSCPRRLKTYLGATMTETRLSSLALMATHHDFQVNTQEVIKAFDASGSGLIMLT